MIIVGEFCAVERYFHATLLLAVLPGTARVRGRNYARRDQTRRDESPSFSLLLLKKRTLRAGHSVELADVGTTGASIAQSLRYQRRARAYRALQPEFRPMSRRVQA